MLVNHDQMMIVHDIKCSFMFAFAFNYLWTLKSRQLNENNGKIGYAQNAQDCTLLNQSWYTLMILYSPHMQTMLSQCDQENPSRQ